MHPPKPSPPATCCRAAEMIASSFAVGQVPVRLLQSHPPSPTHTHTALLLLGMPYFRFVKVLGAACVGGGGAG